MSGTCAFGIGRELLRKLGIILVVAGGGLLSPGADAADRSGPILIGALTESWGPSPSMAGLRDGLLELGYRENEQFVIGVRFTQGDLSALPAAARELVEQGVHILFTSGPVSAQAARMATTQIPIVFGGGGGNPVAQGLVQSFARPGGNITGVADLHL